jgi:HNH endonuclease
MAACLYCHSDGPFTTVEHVIPESLGNDDLLLRSAVCDSCQAYFGKEVERYVLEKTPIAVWRSFLGIPSKKGKLPSIDISQPKRTKGIFPDRHMHHDDIGFSAHPDGTTSVDNDNDKIIEGILDGTKRQFNLALTPKLLHMVGRFLGKVGLGILAINDEARAHEPRFDGIKKYARYGEFEGLWPIFSYTSGEIGDWRRPKLLGASGETVLEEVALYTYSLLEASSKYTLFRFSMGIDNWVICLNDPYPTPIIKSASPGQELQMIWYAPEEWSLHKNNRGNP